MIQPHDMTATETVAAIAAGRLTSETVVKSCLDRIEAREREVKAWVTLDRNAALAQARALDKGPRRGALHGLPVGIKDIVETVGMPTTCGSPIYTGWQSNRDAAVVALCREAGAVILGKTVTTEFASRFPGPTRNPHNPAHTPGGSSSGSAAGVADRMVHAAFGTQTGGSIVRPASYCGVVGFKPTYLAIPMAGVKPYSQSLDTLGPMTRTVRDAALIYSVAAQDPEAAKVEAATPKRIGLCKSPAWSTADASMQKAFEEGARRLKAAGYTVVDRELPDSMRDILAVHTVVIEWEGLTALATERVANHDKLSPIMRETLKRAAGHGAAAHQAALVKAARFRAELDAVFDEVDVIVTPAAPGEAPKGLDSTGEAVFNSPWTLLHVPCISLPGMIGPTGLPIALQAIGKRGEDKRLLSHALALEPVFRT
jgi:Asp-tRNA(Asn)/Glu-tRNA(Gln) amidotransferase A subunit family amidase